MFGDENEMYARRPVNGGICGNPFCGNEGFSFFCLTFADMKVHVFNPENDLALADGRPGFTAPASARQMRADLYWLPEWWADEGDKVWDGEEELLLQPGDEIVPWGWSPALVHQLKKAGVDKEFLPTAERLEALRSLSNRKTAVEALAQLRADGVAGEWMCGESAVCATMDEVRSCTAQWEHTMLKAPWSSSGKGLMLDSAPNMEAWAARILQQQGTVVAERWLHKMVDFAMEFQCDGNGGVEYRGLSLFHTNANGAYTGNWLAPEYVKTEWLGQYVSLDILEEIKEWWTRYLGRFSYKGPVGIDMMLCREGICPCVEINWRMTMGMVAVLLSEQGRDGKMLVHYVHERYVAEIEGFG